MIKKLLIMPIIWLLGMWLYASADTVDGFTSDSEICVSNLSDIANIEIPSDCGIVENHFNDNSVFYACISTSDTPYYVNYDNWNLTNVNYNVSSSVYCLPNGVYYQDSYISISSSEQDVDNWNEELYKSISWKLYYSTSPIIYSSSSDNSNSNSSTVFPSIPSSFTSWITSLVNNFGWTMVAWLPTIILVSLGIFAIFALFRVVKRYAKSSFRW